MSSFFDEFARTLASPMPRRKLLGLIRVFLSGTALAALTTQQVAAATCANGGTACSAGQTCCGSGNFAVCCNAGTLCCAKGNIVSCCGSGTCCATTTGLCSPSSTGNGGAC